MNKPIKLRRPRKQREHELNKAVATYLSLFYPKVYFLHIPNEGKRNPHVGKRLKEIGLTPGAPDIMIFHRKRDIDYDLCGLALELKAGKNNPTQQQHECMLKLLKQGWRGLFIYSFDEAKKVIDGYLKVAPVMDSQDAVFDKLKINPK